MNERAPGDRRRRRRGGSAAPRPGPPGAPAGSPADASPAPPAVTSPPTSPPAAAPAAEQARTAPLKNAESPPHRRRGEHGRPGRGGHRDDGDHGLRDIVGAGRSALGVNGALRGRDLNRPTDEDLAEAERTVHVVRRNWRPPT